jgi:eukaryotic-like serine/threonine-protein kinase
MTPERWRDVERLYHAALERDRDKRAAFLAEACGDDAALLGEVESLLVYRAKSSDFIETPAPDAHPALAAIVERERGRLPVPSTPGGFVGRAFGVYEVQALIATGGMGEVYRGVDTRLNRMVAIKTLPAHLSHDPAWRERLRREAQSVSRLNHPHICTLYDVGVENDIHYLVMEHMEGETLEARLVRGPLAIAAALEYLIQIADALDKAHRRGVVHRDVKPSNIMLTKSGAKVLDFGIAKEMSGHGAPFGAPAGSAQTLTAEGTILGTPQYMAPEQLEGRPADARTDIFAFGALGYEMLTGKRAFLAPSPARLTAAILTDDPQPIAELVPEVPPLLVRTISRCLAKDPEDRWQTANDLLFQLRTIAAAPAPIDGPRSQPARPSRNVERAIWVAVVIASIGGMWLWARNRVVPASTPAQATAAVRFPLSPPAGAAFASSQDVPLALSPDGRQIVYVAAGTNGTRRLWLRELHSEREQVLSGTDGANTPFWSPDSQWVGFFAGNSLKKIRVSSGIAQTVAGNVSTYGGATWSVKDVILFPSTTGGLSRVSALSGPPSQATNGQGQFWPQFLPDGEHFIYAAAAPPRVMVGALGSEPHRTLMSFPVRISVVAYASGHVFYVQDRVLFARPFDQNRLAFSGEAVRVLEGVPVVGNGRAPFSVSAAGVLAYWPWAIGESAVLQWFERDGRATAAVGSPARYLGFALSPDARQLLFSRVDANGGGNLWLRDVERDRETQLTFDAASYTPQWSPDGSRLLFSGPGPGPPPKMFIRSVAGAGAVSQVGAAGLMPDFASSWSNDGDSLISVRIDPVNRNDLWMHRMSDASDTRLSINTTFNESHGRVSPDGRWLAYMTDESGRDEVWLASFPSGEIRRKVSAAGGTMPQWGEGGKELFYLSLDRQLMAASVAARQGDVAVGAPGALFQMPNLIAEGRLLMPTSNNYVATPNGQRFLAAVSVQDPNAPPISVVVNWPALLNRGGLDPSR